MGELTSYAPFVNVLFSVDGDCENQEGGKQQFTSSFGLQADKDLQTDVSFKWNHSMLKRRYFFICVIHAECL